MEGSVPRGWLGPSYPKEDISFNIYMQRERVKLSGFQTWQRGVNISL